MSLEGSKYDTRGARVISAQLYVAKGFKRNPAKMIKFIKMNREYFPDITDKVLEQIKLEHQLNDSDIDSQESVEFADLNAENEYEKELLKKAEEYEKMRKEESRDHLGSGNGTVYKDRIIQELEKMIHRS